jgi:uncharacterized protein (TIGR04255 family)
MVAARYSRPMTTRYARSIPEREVYPNPPIVLAALEVRHSVAELYPSEQRTLKESLRPALPIVRKGQEVTVQRALAIGAEVAGQLTEPTLQKEEFPKYFSRDRTMALSVKATSFVLETTRYESWKAFRELLHQVLDARLGVGRIDGVERVGLRYIDEVRVPDLTSQNGSGWSQWLDDSLLGTAKVSKFLDFEPQEWQGLTVFSTEDNRKVVLRYGNREGYAVDPGGDLKRPTPLPGGPFFLLDFDSFWSYEHDELMLERSVDWLMDLSDDLHDPVRELFEKIIRGKLRSEVLRRGE